MAYTDDEIEKIDEWLVPRGRERGGRLYPWEEIEAEGAVLLEDDWSYAAAGNIEEAEALLDSAWRSRERRLDESWVYHVGRIERIALYIHRHKADLECQMKNGVCQRRSKALIDKIAETIMRTKA